MSEKQQSNGLAIASFVLALVGALLCLIVIGMPLGFICLVLALIFGVIALCKGQKARASILGVLISLCVLIGGWILGKKIAAPIIDFANRMEENPALWDLMSDKEFADQVKNNLTENLQEKYQDSDDIKFFDIWNEVFEDAKQNILELAEQQGINENEEPVVGIANPAAEYCVAQGGESYIVEDEDGSQRGMCRLSDGSEVDEWEYFNAISDVTSNVVEEAEQVEIEETIEK